MDGWMDGMNRMLSLSLSLGRMPSWKDCKQRNSWLVVRGQAISVRLDDSYSS